MGDLISEIMIPSELIITNKIPSNFPPQPYKKGTLYFNPDLEKLVVWNGSNWETIESA